MDEHGLEPVVEQCKKGDMGIGGDRNISESLPRRAHARKSE